MNMNAPQAAPAPVPLFNTATRRFDIPDLDRHGLWLLPRLKQKYPHLNDRGILSWIRNIVFVNDWHFICQDTGVALAQCISAHTLSPKPIIHEHFVWVQDKTNEAQIKAAAMFYEDFKRWAGHVDAGVMIIEEDTDVPHEIIKEKLGRVFVREQKFARL